MDHTTSHRKLEANFAWNVREWQRSAEYIKNRSENISTSITSPFFETENGVQCQLKMAFIFDNGYQCPYWVRFECVFVKLPFHDPKKDCLQVRGTLKVYNEKNDKQYEEIHNENVNTLMKNSRYETGYIEQSNLAQNIRIEAKFEIDGWSAESEVLPPEIIPVTPKLPSLLASNTDFCDITIFVESQEIPAHKAVLAVRSPVMKAMMSADMKEKEESRIVLNDVSAASWRVFQEFLYTDTLTLSSNFDLQLLVELLMMGDKYQVKPLSEAVEAAITSSMTAENVLDIVGAVERFDVSQKLFEKASDIIMKNWETLKSKQDLLSWITAGSLLAKHLIEKLHF